jgi:trypsin
VRFVIPFLILGICLPAFGGTIRHDRDQQQYLDFAQLPQFASTGRFSITRGIPGFNGSGVLVGDRWVLTAAHLIQGAVDMKFIVGGSEYAAEGWVIHQRYDGELRDGFDLGLVRLANPVTNVTPAILNRSKREQGQVAAILGFGRTGDGINGGQPLGEVDFLGRGGTNTIDGGIDLRQGFGNYQAKLKGRIFVYDFDNPTDPADNVMGSPVPTDLEFLISQGDSGGPTFINDPKLGTVLAGIHSFGEFRDERDDSDYGDIGGDTRVAMHRSWITKTMRRGDRGRPIPDFVTPSASATELAPISSAGLPEPSVTLVALHVLALRSPLARPVRRRRHTPRNFCRI